MAISGRSTLTQFLIEERQRSKGGGGGGGGGATDDLNGLINDVSMACKAIARRVAYGSLTNAVGGIGSENVHGEEQIQLDVWSNDLFLRANEWGGHVAGMASEELEEVFVLPAEYPRGKYLLLFDPLDGSSNVDVNVSVGSIFSVLRAPESGREPTTADFLQPGTAQVCAGYAIYGPCTMLVISLGRGTPAFTLDPLLGDWVLSHPHLTIPAATGEFAINVSNSRFWEAGVKRYVNECIAGVMGARERDFNMRWIASLVAETHRILMRGGVFMYPRDSRESGKSGRLRLLYEINPISFLIEQAGGLASTGNTRAMEVLPVGLHERAGFVFGSRDEVSRIERYHREEPGEMYASPLFGRRGLFAAPE